LVYVTYQMGRWVLENRENLKRRGQRLRITVADRLHLSDKQTQVLTGGGTQSLASVGSGTLVLRGQAMAKPRSRSSADGTLAITHPNEKPHAWEELLWWYLRVR
jgi:hypothetical protein